MKKFIIYFSAFILLLVCQSAAFAQCGPAGLDPCMIAKSAARTVVKKANNVKKAVVRETAKTPAKSNQSKSKSAKTTKSNKSDTSIYDSLSVKNKPETPADDSDLFPVYSVIIGTTTERQMQILGGARNTFTDQTTGQERVYYTINNLNFWVRDGVADSVGVYKFLDTFPKKWQLYGFDFNLSYRESVKLLRSMNYEVQEFPDLPKFEDIGKVSRTPRIVATKKGNVPVKIAMSFLLEKGQTYDSPETLLYMFAGVNR